MIHPQAGQLPAPDQLIQPQELVSAYYALTPDPDRPSQAVCFGTSGHRGVSPDRSFNEAHVLAISQAICVYRRQAGISGPLFVGRDTHALSEPALHSCLEVLCANGVQARIQNLHGFTPTPAVSAAVVDWNRGRSNGLADGIVLTPSHNPPEYGGFKYNPSHGGPAGTEVTRTIQTLANAYLAENNRGIARMSLAEATRSGLLAEYDFIGNYLAGLADLIDFPAIAASGVKLGVNPLGGASLDYWPALADLYKLDLTVLEPGLDPAFSFVPLDHDGKIRMDCSSAWVMRSSLHGMGDCDLVLACDPDADRHGILTRQGLLPSNAYLGAAAHFLFSRRPDWKKESGLGKTVVTSSLLDRVALDLRRPLLETPVGFKWFVPGLSSGSLNFGCEESAGGSFSRFDGRPWSTDKDGLAMGLLAAELLAKSGRDPAEYYDWLTEKLGRPHNLRVDFALDADKSGKLSGLGELAGKLGSLAGEKVLEVQTAANGHDFGGIKVKSENSWFAIRPSGTEPICKVYLETFAEEEKLGQIQATAFELLELVLA